MATLTSFARFNSDDNKHNTFESYKVKKKKKQPPSSHQQEDNKKQQPRFLKHYNLNSIIVEEENEDENDEAHSSRKNKKKTKHNPPLNLNSIYSPRYKHTNDYHSTTSGTTTASSSGSSSYHQSADSGGDYYSASSSNENNKHSSDNVSSINAFNLYRTPTITHVKQKYKMYLDWLNERQSNRHNNHQETEGGGRRRLLRHLNWYDYERSVLLNEEKTNGENSLALPHLAKAKWSSGSSSSGSSRQLPKRESASSNEVLSSPQASSFLASNYLILDTNRRILDRNSNNQSCTNSGEQTHHETSSSSTSSEYNYQIATKAKGVKFGEQDQQQPYHNQQTNSNIVKPILKASEAVGRRRSSLSSLVEAMQQTRPQKYAKLPPIASSSNKKYSDDFYAVLNEMENEFKEKVVA